MKTMRRRGVEPEEPERTAEQGPHHHRHLTGTGDVLHEQVVRPVDAADGVGDHRIRDRRGGDATGREAIHAVGEVHRVRGAGEHQHRQQQERHAKPDRQVERRP
jgi:hypothetical protein